MPVQLKICGITNREDALEVAALGVTILGFNFYPQSPRYITPESARKIIQELPPTVITVGIMVHPTPGQARLVAETSGIHWLQVYAPRYPAVFYRLPLPIIECHQVGGASSEISWPAQGDFLLLDAYHPQKKGGTGKTFAWDQIPSHIPRDRLILAGGISPLNIKEALHQVQPAIVDVASGAEIAPGKKDLEKVKALQLAILEYNLNSLKLKKEAISL